MIVEELAAKLGLEIDETMFVKGEAMIEGLSHSFMAFGSAAAAALMIVGAEIAKSTAEAGDKARKLAQSTGVDSIVLQEFAYSAGLADLETEALAHGLQHLAKTGVKDVRGEVLKLSAQMQKMPNDGAKVALAMSKFGRGGAKMIPWLNAGAEGLADMADEAHLLGVVFSEEDQAASEEFNDELRRLGSTFTGIKNAIGLKLIRPLTHLFTAFRLWITDVRRGGKALDQLVTIMKTVAWVIGTVLLTQLYLAASAAVATAGGFTALGMAALRAGLSAAASWLAATLPVLALGVAIGAALLLLEDMWVAANGGRSIMGRFGTEWVNWFDAYTKDQAKDPWWLRMLKDGLAALSDLETTWKRIKNSDFVSFLTFNPFAKKEGAYSHPDAAPAAMGYGLRWSGGAAGPDWAAAQNPGNQPMVLAPNIHTELTVNVPPGQSPLETANALKRALDEHHDSKMREAQAGVE